MVFWRTKSSEAAAQEAETDSQGIALESTGRPVLETAAISKPFNLMSLEELLDSLPACGPEVINELWVPELKRKVAALKNVLQKAEERSFSSYKALIATDNVSHTCTHQTEVLTVLTQDLHAFGREAKRFPQMYDSVIKDAELLAEKNVDELRKHLDEVEDRLAELNVENQKLGRESSLRSKEATAAQYNVYAIVDSIRPVLEQALRHPAFWDRVQYQMMHQVLQDYPPAEGESAVSALRLPQQVYHQLVADLRESQDTVNTMREVASEQAQLIHEQSGSLSDNLNRYEQVFHDLQTRNHEVLLLDNRNKELQGALQDYEGALKRAEQDRHRIRDLHGQINDVTQFYESRLKEKDAALLQMRVDLDRVQKQLMDTQVDLRNAHTSQGVTAGPGIDKPRPLLPSSYSSFALNVRDLSEHAEPARPHQTYRIRAPPADLAAPHQAGFVVTHSPSVARSLAQPIHARRLSDPFQDSPGGVRPRGASLDSETVLVYRPHGGVKPLPSPPTVSPTIPSNATLAPQTNIEDAGAAAFTNPRPSPQFHMRDLNGPETPVSGKRMLSIIAEASQEGSNSQKSVSATSSEKNEYRSSISALALLNSESSPASDETESPVMHASWADAHRRQRQGPSPDLDVSKLYHQDRQHL
jgi:hypothetical protein